MDDKKLLFYKTTLKSYMCDEKYLSFLLKTLDVFLDLLLINVNSMIGIKTPVLSTRKQSPGEAELQ